MNSVDDGNLIHITHSSSVLPKESRGEQSFTITYPCFALMWQDYIHFSQKLFYNSLM